MMNIPNNTNNVEPPSASCWGARCACIVAAAPIALLTRDSYRTAAYLYVLLQPLTAPPLQEFAQRGGMLTGSLCRLCLCIGNAAAVLACTDAYPLISHGLFALALCLGCVQLLLMVHKGHVLRVMGCTAVAVMVSALALAAALSPPLLARRFFQAAGLPFVLFFLETARGLIAPPLLFPTIRDAMLHETTGARSI